MPGPSRPGAVRDGLHLHRADPARAADPCRPCRRLAAVPPARGRAGAADHRPRPAPFGDAQHADPGAGCRTGYPDRLHAGGRARPTTAICCAPTGCMAALSDRTIRDRARPPRRRRRNRSQTGRAGAAGRIGDNATALVVDVVALPDADRFDLEAGGQRAADHRRATSGATIDGYTLGRMLSDGRYSRVFQATGTPTSVRSS